MRRLALPAFLLATGAWLVLLTQRPIPPPPPQFPGEYQIAPDELVKPWPIEDWEEVIA